MNIISSIKEMQSFSEELRLQSKSIAVVPTMGALHTGHLSLLDIAKRKSDVTIATIFVNQKQFAPHEDFNKYPRNLESDIDALEQYGCDVLFTPSSSEMYTDTFSTYVNVEHYDNVLEGRIRPSHFRGVATVVAKLFNCTKPQVAVFGQKDAQQVFIIQQMNRDLNFGIEIIVAPVVREADGLAMSSRNVYLSASEREDATVLYHALLYAEQMVFNGEQRPPVIITGMKQRINAKPAVSSIDYVSITNADTLAEADILTGGNTYLVSLAVRFGMTRLIDNIIIHL